MTTTSPKDTPESDCEMLLNRAFRLAQQILDQYGEFHPFGLALANDRQVEPVTFQDERDFPAPEEVVKVLENTFMARAQKGEVLATALATNIKTALPSGAPTDAVAIALNHRDNYSIMALIPYELQGGKAVPGVLFTKPGEGGIFPSRQ